MYPAHTQKCSCFCSVAGLRDFGGHPGDRPARASWGFRPALEHRGDDLWRHAWVVLVHADSYAQLAAALYRVYRERIVITAANPANAVGGGIPVISASGRARPAVLTPQWFCQ